MIRFNEQEIRLTGRTASGVKGINIDNGIVVGCEIAESGQQILVVTENGYGKKTDLDYGKHPHNKSPSPDKYQIDTFVDFNKTHQRGSSCHIGRDVYTCLMLENNSQRSY